MKRQVGNVNLLHFTIQMAPQKWLGTDLGTNSFKVGCFERWAGFRSAGKTDLSEALTVTDCHYVLPDRWSCGRSCSTTCLTSTAGPLVRQSIVTICYSRCYWLICSARRPKACSPLKTTQFWVVVLEITQQRPYLRQKWSDFHSVKRVLKRKLSSITSEYS